MIRLRKSGNILPIEALRKNEDSKNGKLKTKKHSYRIVRADVYLAVKIITARMRENIVMLTTIALLVAISIVGASFSTIIKSNNEKYYRIGIEKEGKNCTLQIAYIMQDNKMMYWDAYIGIHNEDFIQETAWVGKIYINGDSQYIDNKLENMKNDFPYLKWANYSDVLSANNRDIDNRYLMIEIVVRILVIIASIGWINSLRNIFLSRVKDYDIIRMQEVSRIRLAKIMVYQIIIYLLNGTILGCIIGSLIVEALLYWDQNRLTFNINFNIVYQMIVIMLLFCLLLIPVIHKICNKQLLEDNR